MAGAKVRPASAARRCGAVALAAAVAASRVQAETPGWSHAVTVYGWLPSASATIGTPFGGVTVNRSLSEILDQLRFAAFATLDSRRGPLSLILDLAHSDLSDSRSFLPGAPFGGARIDTTITTVSGLAAYRVLETASAGVDVTVGLRLHDLSLRADLAPGLAPRLAVRSSDRWVDPVIGSRLSWRFDEAWRGAVSLDAGGFGIGDASDLSWQAAAEVEWSFTDVWSVMLGYRHLEVDRPQDRRAFTLRVSGPVVGLRARF